jgi:AAA domain, putative AbiEii toxin, Type IV TA system/AAA domain
MYTSLHIKGFRCFRDLKIEKLARINLIGGKNNTGKTALLEAMVLGAAGIHQPGLPAFFYEMRGLPVGDAAGKFGFADLFAGMQPGAPALLMVGAEQRPVRTLTVTPLPVQEMQIAVGGAEPGPAGVVAPKPGFSTPVNLDLVLSDDGGEIGRAEVRFSGDKLNFAGAPPEGRAGAILLSARLREQPGIEANRYTHAMERRLEAHLDQALKAVDPRLERVRLAHMGQTPYFLADLTGSPPMPLNMVGEGMMRVCTLALALLSVPGGLVLVDEIENGLHYRVMPKVWAAIAQAAKDLDVQVFATTHSYECVAAAVEGIGEGVGEDEFLYHRLDRVDDDIVCRTFAGDALPTALEMNLEVR